MNIETGENLVFLVGSPRSGTTWLQKTLAQHSEISSGQESDLMDHYLGPLVRNWEHYLRTSDGRDALGLGCYLTCEEFYATIRNFVGMLLTPMLVASGNKPVFLEKTPSHALFIPEIVKLFPKAKIIHVLRDPRAVCNSLIEAGRSWGKTWAPSSVSKAYRLWLDHVSAVDREKCLIAPCQFFQVRYEQMTQNPEKLVGELLVFLNLSATKKEVQEFIRKGMDPQLNRLPLYGELGKRLKKTEINEPDGFHRRDSKGWRTELSLFNKIQLFFYSARKMRELDYYWKLSDFM